MVVVILVQKDLRQRVLWFYQYSNIFYACQAHHINELRLYE